MNSAIKIVLVSCCSKDPEGPITLEFTTIGSQATWMYTAAEGTVVKYLPNGGDQSLAGCYKFTIQPDTLPPVANIVPDDSEITTLGVNCESAREVDPFCSCDQAESNCYMIDACNDEELPFEIALDSLAQRLVIGYVYSFSDPSNYLQTAGCFKVVESVDCNNPIFVDVEVTVDHNSTDCDICVPCYELTDCSDPSNTLNIQWEPDAEPLDPNISYTFTFAPGVCWSAKLGTSPCEATRYDSRNITGGASSCEECLRRCYKLIDCEGLYPTISTESILFETYVGKTILWQDQLAVEHCATVELYNCEQEIIPTEPIIVLDCYDTCEKCLYVPVPAPIINLGSRTVRPGYDTPGCPPEYYEKVNCKFSEYVFQNMIAKRYGLDSCCDINQEKYEIKKALLDLAVVTDPNICNPQCLGYGIDILENQSAITTYLNCDGEESEIITLPSTSPINVSFCALRTQCPVSTVYSETGETTYFLEPLGPCTIDPPVDNRCLTNIVLYAVGAAGRTTYTNCSGERVFVEADGQQITPVSIDICIAPNPNYVFTGTEPIITVTDVECVDPPPCVELNYRLTYDAIEIGGRFFNTTDCEGVITPYSVPTYGEVYEVCSVEPPVITGLPPTSIEVIGECAPQLACSIYQIQAGAGGGGGNSMDYIDCQGNAQNRILIGFEVFEVCGIPGQILSCDGGCKGFTSIEIENACS